MNFWHMQMHPTDEIEFSENIDWILEQKKNYWARAMGRRRKTN